LLNAAKLKPQLILTDRADMLAVRPVAGVPMARVMVRDDDPSRLVVESAPASNAAPASRRQASDPASPWCDGQWIAGGFKWQAAPGFESDHEAVAGWIAMLTEHVDLAEPFGRIHEAIREAQRIGGHTVESHGQAA
jgi:hypothetical protein